MDKIDNLLKLATTFYERAVWSYLVNKAEAKSLVKQAVETFTMPDDPEEEDEATQTNENLGKYDDIINVARQLNDSGLSSELLMLAELYKKAIEINGGYSSLNKSIGNIINMYLEDEDDPQQEEVEELLNEVVKDLRARAGGPGALSKPDSSQAVAELKKVKDAYNSQSLQEDFDELNKGQFDPTAGLSKEDAGKGTGRGYMVRTRKTPKDWAESFENERARYVDTMATEPNKVVRDKMKKLTEVLAKLRTNVLQESALTESLAGLEQPDPQEVAKLEALREETKGLKKERRNLKVGIRDHELAKDQKRLEEELKSATNPKEKIRLHHEVELFKTLQSKDIGKTQERNWRRVLLKSMSGGNWPGEETLKNLESKIQEAAKLRKPIGEVYKERAVQKREIIQSGTLLGLIKDLGVKLGTQKVVVKQTVTDAIVAKIVAEKAAEFKPYLDKIAAAKAAKNTAAVKAASKELAEAMDKKAINAEAELHPTVMAFVEILKGFYGFRDSSKIVAESLGDGETNPEAVPAIQGVIDEGKGLIERYSGTKYLDTVITLTQSVVSALQGRISNTDNNSADYVKLPKLSPPNEVSSQEWNEHPLTLKYKQDAIKKREKIQSGSLEGLVILLGHKLATQKSTAKQRITDKMNIEKTILFRNQLQRIEAAKLANDPKELKYSIEELRVAMNEYAETQLSILDYKNKSKPIYDWKNKLLILSKTDEEIPKETLDDLIREGISIIDKFQGNKIYNTSLAVVQAIISHLNKRTL